MDALLQSVASRRFCVAPAKGVDVVASCSGTSVRASVGARPVASLRAGFLCRSRNAVASKVPVARGKSSGHRAVVCMAADSAAAGYAGALADLAKSTSTLDKVNEDVDKVASVLEDPEVFDFLVSPVVPDEKKKDVLAKLAKDARFNQYTLSFLYLLVDKKRIGLIKDIVKEFEVLYNVLTNTQAAVVTSAVKIQNSQLALIAKKIQSLSGAQNVRLKNVIDPSLIAGFIIKYGKDGSSSIDMSVKGQLDRLAAQFEYADKVGFTR